MKRAVLALALSAAACGGHQQTSGIDGVVRLHANDAREPIAATDLPDPVIAAVRSHQRASLVSATKLTREGRVVFYDLRLAGTRKTHMLVEPDGHVLTFD